MNNEKSAFLAPALGLVGNIAGGMVGANLARTRLAPLIYNAFKSTAKSTPKTFVGKAKKTMLGWAGKKRNAEMLSETLGMLPGSMVGAGLGGIAAAPFSSEEKYAHDNSEYTQKQLLGFLKAAHAVELSPETTAVLVKRAFGNYDLRPEDIARIRLSLQERGVAAPYSDPNGILNANYNQNILQARDRSLDQIPEMEGALSAASRGLTGGLVGGAAGLGLGKLLNRPGILGNSVSYGLRKNLPGGLGAGAGMLGALLGALPAYKQKVDEVRGLQKLNYPENLHKLISTIEADKTLLNS
jgi:hypothetical protein